MKGFLSISFNRLLLKEIVQPKITILSLITHPIVVFINTYYYYYACILLHVNIFIFYKSYVKHWKETFFMYIYYELAYVFYVYMINIEMTGKHMTVVGRFVFDPYI